MIMFNGIELSEDLNNLLTASAIGRERAFARNKDERPVRFVFQPVGLSELQ